MDFASSIEDQHFMLQKEVVERMVAEPGGKAYGRLSVMLQWRYDMDMLFVVPPEAFEPPPKVDSAIVRMIPREMPEKCSLQALEKSSHKLSRNAEKCCATTSPLFFPKPNWKN